ncbi:MAG: hypothetical protein IT349_08985 [Candidatus Eisenbacteria bacterium]|nr:hypothetical protein [Candidatus Eisenbacteria bacterium]
MSEQPYVVEFYPEGGDCWERLESQTPFQAFHVGDVVQHAFWHGSKSPETALLVTRVEHVLWKEQKAGCTHHKLMVHVREFDQQPS